jgi:hypothetical protein
MAGLYLSGIVHIVTTPDGLVRPLQRMPAGVA